MSKSLTLAFSPCPNDTFIFDALVNDKIDLMGMSFDVKIDDVETLNRSAFSDYPDVTKLSFHAFMYLQDKYKLLTAGAALGNGCGPLLVGKDVFTAQEIATRPLKVAIPGKYTTANLLLNLAFPELTDKVEMVFSEIEDAVVNKSVDMGLIIHENRFTYEQKGLIKIADLGEIWEKKTKLPIPLGGIVVSRTLEPEIQHKMNNMIQASIKHAQLYPEDAMSFVHEHATNMNKKVLTQHISMYVNEYSLSLGRAGTNAVNRMIDEAISLGIIKLKYDDIFVD